MIGILRTSIPDFSSRTPSELLRETACMGLEGLMMATPLDISPTLDRAELKAFHSTDQLLSAGTLFTYSHRKHYYQSYQMSLFAKSALLFEISIGVILVSNSIRKDFAFSSPAISAILSHAKPRALSIGPPRPNASIMPTLR